MREVNDQHDTDPLLTRARALSRHLEPDHDLWPGIEGRLQDPGESPVNRWTRPRLAAAAAVLITVSSLTSLWIGGTFDSRQTREMASQAAQSLAARSQPRAMGAEFIQTRTDLVFALEREMEDLSPESREVVAANLLKIDDAINDINTALADNPNSDLLLHLLLSAYTDQLTLLGDINGMTRSSRAAAKRTQL